MSDEGQDGAIGGGADEKAAATQPSLAIVRQYIKDISFENPNAPGSLDPDKGPPQIQLGVNIQARAGENSLYEVELRIEAKANHGEDTAFVVELVYGALFQLKDFPADTVEMICMIECPRLIFPFARRVVADITRDGGYSPLLLDPIDFSALYRDHKNQMAAQQMPAGHA